MILEEILKILKKKSDQKAYTVNNKSYTYKELYKYVCNLYNFLLEKNPDIPHYPVNDLQVKVPAGWLIEQAGLKGYRKGDAGVHTKQALVLVNYGNATGEELINLAKYVQATVLQKFGIEINPEVNII